MMVAFAAGCQEYMRNQGVGAGLQPKQPAPATPAKTFTGTPQPVAQTEPITLPADPNRTEEAREEVLAFIHRLERLREGATGREPGAGQQVSSDDDNGVVARHERWSSRPAAARTRDVADLRSQHERTTREIRAGNTVPSESVAQTTSPPISKPKIVSVSIRQPETVKPAGDRPTALPANEEPLPSGSRLGRPQGRGSDSRSDDEQRLANRPMATEPVTTAEDALRATYDAFMKEVAANPSDIESRWRLALVAVGLGLPSNAALSAGEGPLPDGRGSDQSFPDGRGSDQSFPDGRGSDQSPPDGRGPVSSSMGEPDHPIAESLPGMPVESARVFARSLDALVATRRAVDDPIEATDRALATVNALRDALRPQAQLVIPAVAMCSRVQAFGVYDELSEGYLRPYTRNEAIVYFEVGNFTWEHTEDGRYRSVISDRFEVMDAGGEVLWQREEPSIEDLSRARREDFFVAQRITLPASLKEGDYVLKITVEDKLAGKATQAIHNFHVGVPTRTAARQ